MQTLKRVWNEDWRANFQQFSLREPKPVLVRVETTVSQITTASPTSGPTIEAEDLPAAPEPAAGNVVRPDFVRAASLEVSPHRQRPDLLAAFDVVAKAAELIKAAEARASQAERQAASVALRSCAQIEALEREVRTAQELVHASDTKWQAAERSAEEQVRAAEAQTSAAWKRVLEIKAELETANAKLFSAETTIAEAREDMQCLLDHVRERIGASVG